MDYDEAVAKNQLPELPNGDIDHEEVLRLYPTRWYHFNAMIRVRAHSERDARESLVDNAIDWDLEEPRTGDWGPFVVAGELIDGDDET